MISAVRQFDHIISKFPQSFSLLFAYGSSVFPQDKKPKSNAQENMIDFIFAVDNPLAWHRSNLEKNRNHYSFVKYGGAEFVKNLQEYSGANVYFNTLVQVEDKLIKYGVINTSHLIEDLLDWKTLYMSGRLHKPVTFLTHSHNVDLQRAIHTNLQSALHASLLMLPERFSEEELYIKITELSYRGDFRMYFGEDKQKVQNIVKNQIPYFRNLYSDHLKSMPLLHWNPNQNTIEQDGNSATLLHHLNLLPKTVQHNLLVRMNKYGRYRDLEDTLQVVAFDPECSNIVQEAIENIVFWPSISQSAKGILTAVQKYKKKYVKKIEKQ